MECLEPAQQHGSQYPGENGGRASEWGRWVPLRLLTCVRPFTTPTALTHPSFTVPPLPGSIGDGREQDTAIRAIRTRCDVGGILRDSKGIVIFAFCVPLARSFSPLVAEAMSVLYGLERVLNLGVKKVVIQSDCEVVVNLIKTKSIPMIDVVTSK